MSEIKRWTRVEVTDESGQVVAIEDAMLAGRDIGEREREAITDSIRTLCGFIGLPDPVDGVQERDTLARRVEEWQPNGYDVELHWGWGRTCSFRETERFHVQSLDEIDAIVQRFIIRIARRYTFDCGDISKPMHPHLAGLTVTPTARRQYQSTERFDTMMERERAYTETLIQSGGLYKGSDYDLSPAPPVTGGPR